MIVHTPLSSEAVREIAAQYHLEVKTFAPLGAGSGNSNFLLETQQGKVILSLFEEQSEEQVIVIARLLQWLEQHGFTTSRLLSNTSGKRVLFHRQKPLLLKTYLPGQVYFDLGEVMLEQVGSALAHLHQIPAPGYLPDHIYYELPKFTQVIGLGIDPGYESWLEERIHFLPQHFPQDLPRGLIHGDLFCDNVLFEEEQLIALIDFELACQYFLVFDIGMAIAGLCTTELALDWKKARALVEGYQQVRVLEPQERVALKHCTEYAAVKTSNWRFHRYCYYNPDPEKKHKHLQMVRLAEEIRSFSETTFQARLFSR